MDTNDKPHPPSPQSGRVDRRMMKFNPLKEEGSRLIEFVKKQQLLKTAEEERKKPTHELPEDCFSYILRLLPIKALLLSRCVCKLLNDITKHESFIKSHLSHSEPVLLYFTNRPPPLRKKPEIFVVEAHAQEDEALNLFKHQQLAAHGPDNYLYFLDITEDGMSLTVKSFNIGFSGRVLGCCNGLIVLENRPRKAGLIIINPVTRKLMTYRAGTIVPLHKESYGFAFDTSRKEHKLVHIFLDGSYVSCEILTLEKRRWKMVDGPSLVIWPFSGLINLAELEPIAAMGALHWVPVDSSHSKIGVSIDLEQEKFFQLVLPEIRGKHDGFVVMKNHLCFVSHGEENLMITIWMLMSLNENVWSKCHSIPSISSRFMDPLISSRSGSCMVFRMEKTINHVGVGVGVDDDDDEEEVEDEVEDEVEEDGGEGEVEGEEAFGELEIGNTEENGPYYIYDFIHGELRRMKMKKGLAPLIPRFLFPHVNSLASC